MIQLLLSGLWPYEQLDIPTRFGSPHVIASGLQDFHHWHVEWVEVVNPEDVVLPTEPVLMSLQAIASLSEEASDHGETSSRVRLVTQPMTVMLDRVAHQYARATAGIGTDQLWAALRQWGAATLTSRDGY